MQPESIIRNIIFAWKGSGNIYLANLYPYHLQSEPRIERHTNYYWVRGGAWKQSLEIEITIVNRMSENAVFLVVIRSRETDSIYLVWELNSS